MGTFGLVGVIIEAGAYYPTASDLSVNFGAGVVDQNGLILSYPSGLDIVITPFGISIELDNDEHAAKADFNGIILTNKSRDFPMAYTLDAGSTLTPVSYGAVGNKFYVNVSDLYIVAGNIISFTALAPVPEPQTYALLMAGLSILVLLAKRSKGRRETGLALHL